jgi:shikimate 5-dehydrogenase
VEILNMIYWKTKNRTYTKFMIDSIYNEDSLLQINKNTNNNYISGFDMYLYQAIMQLSNWFDIPVDTLKELKENFSIPTNINSGFRVSNLLQ